MKNILKIFSLILISVGGGGCDLFSIFSTPIQKRGVQGFIDDNWIRFRLNVLISGEDGTLEFLIHQGTVMVLGTVADEKAHGAVLKKIQQVPGIKTCIDKIQVGKDTFASYMRDVFLARKLKALLFCDTRIHGQDYHVGVANRRVYILGVARSQEELHIVLEHAENLPGILEVCSYVTVVASDDLSLKPQK